MTNLMFKSKQWLIWCSSESND